MVHPALKKKLEREQEVEEKKCKYWVMCSDFRTLRPPVPFPETRLPSVPSEHTQMDAQIGSQIGSRKGVKCGLKEGLQLTLKLFLSFGIISRVLLQTCLLL